MNNSTIKEILAVKKEISAEYIKMTSKEKKKLSKNSIEKFIKKMGKKINVIKPTFNKI